MNVIDIVVPTTLKKKYFQEYCTTKLDVPV